MFKAHTPFQQLYLRLAGALQVSLWTWLVCFWLGCCWQLFQKKQHTKQTRWTTQHTGSAIMPTINPKNQEQLNPTIKSTFSSFFLLHRHSTVLLKSVPQQLYSLPLSWQIRGFPVPRGTGMRRSFSRLVCNPVPWSNVSYVPGLKFPSIKDLEYCQTLRVPSRGTPKIQISQRNSDFGGPLTGLICSFHVGFVMFSRLGPLQRDPWNPDFAAKSGFQGSP